MRLVWRKSLGHFIFYVDNAEDVVFMRLFSLPEKIYSVNKVMVFLLMMLNFGHEQDLGFCRLIFCRSSR